MVHQPDLRQRQVAHPQRPFQQLPVVYQQPPNMALGAYQGPPDAGYAGTMGGPAPLFGMRPQSYPQQGQMPPLQGPVEQTNLVHQHPQVVAVGPFVVFPGYGFPGAAGGPTLAFCTVYQLDPRQGQARLP